MIVATLFHALAGPEVHLIAGGMNGVNRVFLASVPLWRIRADGVALAVSRAVGVAYAADSVHAVTALLAG